MMLFAEEEGGWIKMDQVGVGSGVQRRQHTCEYNIWFCTLLWQMINVSCLVIQCVLLEIYVWLGLDQPSAKAGWRCATITHGGQCVVIHGA